jgi:hypothetical protein
MALGVGAAAIAGAFAWWFVVARRRSEDEEPPPMPALAAAPTYASRSAATAPAVARRKRELADWELASALDDAPIGTVDYMGGAEELPPDIEAALDAPVIHVEPGNARTRRLAEMHSWRDETDRRSLLRRVGLPEVDGD